MFYKILQPPRGSFVARKFFYISILVQWHSTPFSVVMVSSTKVFLQSFTGKIYTNITDMVNSLRAHEVDGILLDLYTAASRTDLINDTWMVVSKIILHKFTYGVVLGGDAAKLHKSFQDYVKNRQARIIRILQKSEEEHRKVCLPHVYPYFNPRTYKGGRGQVDPP